MRSYRRSVFAFFGVVLMMFGVTSALAQQGDVSSHPMIGAEAPSFELTTTDGKKVSLNDWKGKFVVLHFGASW